MKLHISHRQSKHYPSFWTGGGTSAAAVLMLTCNALGAKPGGGGGEPPPPPASAVYTMERITSPGWGNDHQVENISAKAVIRWRARDFFGTGTQKSSAGCSPCLRPRHSQWCTMRAGEEASATMDASFMAHPCAHRVRDWSPPHTRILHPWFGLILGPAASRR